MKYLSKCVRARVYVSLCLCVCVNTTGTSTVSRTQTCGFSRVQGVPGDCRRLAPTKTFLLSCEIDLGRQVDVPAVCDTLNRASCVLLPY